MGNANHHGQGFAVGQRAQPEERGQPVSGGDERGEPVDEHFVLANLEPVAMLRAVENDAKVASRDASGKRSSDAAGLLAVEVPAICA